MDGPMTDVPKTILVIGTYDTKDDELRFIGETILGQGGRIVTMDVSVLGDPNIPCDHTKHDVVAAAGTTIDAIIALNDENQAMQAMAKGATALTLKLWREGAFDGVLVLGGSMGTDLALDVTAALPIGVPKYIVSTVSFSHMIPPDRLAPDVQMILWAGGLYGLNSVCKASLSQAAGAVLGAAQAVIPRTGAPLIGMTSLGKNALRYMVHLKPALEARGYEVAVCHATGMGGRAFEALAAQGDFACVFDFCTQELGNEVFGSSITAGPDRLTGAGMAGTPQIVAPGCYDLVDFVGWRPLDDRWQEHPQHAHNRLITSVVLNTDERCEVARAHAIQLAKAKGKTVLMLPSGGCGEWDRTGAELHDEVGLGAFLNEIKAQASCEIAVVDAHINDASFSEAALAIFDSWREAGTI